MANTITLTFAGDDKSLSRTFDKVGDSALDMGKDLERAEDSTGKLSRGVSSMNDRIDSSESKFMGAADLADGLSTSLGLNIGPAIEMSRAFGDMAGGFTQLVGPALENLTGKFSKATIVTKAQTLATQGLNMVMRANPALLVVAGIAALIAIFIVAYKKVDWFRNGVNAAFAGIRKSAEWVAEKFDWMVDKLSGAVTSGARTIGKIADIITTPYQLAFRGIASLWNNTVGRLSFSVPGWVPGLGGKGFDVPDIPQLASGGIARAGRPHIVGENGPELFIPGMTGTVVPNGAGAGTQRIVVTFAAGDPLWEALKKNIRVKGGVGPNSVQMALG